MWSRIVPSTTYGTNDDDRDNRVDLGGRFVGRWSFTRIIEDRRDGHQLKATGFAEISAVDDLSLTWLESGELFWEGAQIAVGRRLKILSSAERPTEWWVVFPDGRRFHPFALGKELIHACGDDLYRGRITLRQAMAWEMLWEAVGPFKDYSSTTTYVRSGP
jgi:hypothetical protein